jgi:lipoprotein-releasing system permease protein
MAAISLVAGLVLGVGLSLAQQQWGLVSLTTQTLLIDSYPIDLRWGDVVLCALTYGVVAFAVIHLTVRGALRKAD